MGKLQIREIKKQEEIKRLLFSNIIGQNFRRGKMTNYFAGDKHFPGKVRKNQKINRSSLLQVLFRIAALKNLAKFTGKQF